MNINHQQNIQDLASTTIPIQLQQHRCHPVSIYKFILNFIKVT